MESAQKVYKVSVGEPDSIEEQRGNTVQVNVTPAEAVRNLEETLNNPIEEKTFKDIIDEFETEKQSSELNEGKL